MTYKFRRELQATLKHALFYSGRFLMQVGSNIWHTVKGQQILQLSICALISLGYNIHLGIIEWDKAALNTQSVMYFCGTLFILVFVWSFISAPFHLDREREDTIKELEQKITIQIKPPLTEIKTKSKEVPQQPEKLEPVLECVSARIVRVNADENRVIYKHNEGRLKAAVVDFRLKPIKNSITSLAVRATITFNGLGSNKRHIVRDGIWTEFVKEPNEYAEFKIGDIRGLAVALFLEDEVTAYEYNVEKVWDYMEVLVPNLTILEGKEFRVEIELIGQHYGDLALNKIFKFQLSSEPLKFEEIKS